MGTCTFFLGIRQTLKSLNGEEAGKIDWGPLLNLCDSILSRIYFLITSPWHIPELSLALSMGEEESSLTREIIVYN